MKPLPLVSNLVFAALAVLLAVLLTVGRPGSASRAGSDVSQRLEALDRRIASLERVDSRLDELASAVSALEQRARDSGALVSRDAGPPRRSEVGRALADAGFTQLRDRVVRMAQLTDLDAATRDVVLDAYAEEMREVRKIRELESDQQIDAAAAEDRIAAIRRKREDLVRTSLGADVYKRVRNLLPKAPDFSSSPLPKR